MEKDNTKLRVSGITAQNRKGAAHVLLWATVYNSDTHLSGGKGMHVSRNKREMI